MENTENNRNSQEEPVDDVNQQQTNMNNNSSTSVITTLPTKIMKTRNEFPVGYRFQPRDDELIQFYLGKKITNQPLPRDDIIDEVVLIDYTPAQLVDMFDHMGEDVWYFFTPTEKKYMNGGRPKRGISEDSGYWRPSGCEIPVYKNDNKADLIIGTKRALSFYEGKQQNGKKTEWRMYEYKALKEIFPPQNNGNKDPNSMRLDDWVLCKLYKIAEKKRKEDGDTNNNNNDGEAGPSSRGPPPSRTHIRMLPPDLPMPPSRSEMLSQMLNNTNQGGFHETECGSSSRGWSRNNGIRQNSRNTLLPRLLSMPPSGSLQIYNSANGASQQQPTGSSTITSNNNNVVATGDQDNVGGGECGRGSSSSNINNNFIDTDDFPNLDISGFDEEMLNILADLAQSPKAS